MCQAVDASADVGCFGSTYEQKFVTSYVLPAHESTWVGLIQDPDADSGDKGGGDDYRAGWRCSNGQSASLRNWAPHEPNQYIGAEEDCAMLRHPDHGSSDELHDLCCSIAHYVPLCLCELRVASAEVGSEAGSEAGSGDFPPALPNPAGVECRYEEGSWVGALVFLLLVLLFAICGTGVGLMACYKAKCCCWARPHHTGPMSRAGVIEVPSSSVRAPPVAVATVVPVSCAGATGAMPVATGTVISSTAVPIAGCQPAYYPGGQRIVPIATAVPIR